jgi:hypothetical protein
MISSPMDSGKIIATYKMKVLVNAFFEKNKVMISQMVKDRCIGSTTLALWSVARLAMPTI